jgi:membrane-associated phospholipid phosphatase
VLRFFADYTLIIVLAVSGLVFLYDGVKKSIWRQYPYLIMAGLTSLLIAKFLSLAYQPSSERPFLIEGVAPGAAYIDNPGFPSDHALLGVVAVLGVYALTGRKKLTGVLAIIVIVMMAARVIALVHTPLDIAGGVVAGLLGGLWYLEMRKSKA